MSIGLNNGQRTIVNREIVAAVDRLPVDHFPAAPAQRLGSVTFLQLVKLFVLSSNRSELLHPLRFVLLDQKIPAFANHTINHNQSTSTNFL